MESSREILQVLSEIRDLQVKHLQEYREFASRSVEIQEAAVNKQAAFGALYIRVVLGGGILVFGLIAFLIVFLFRNW